MEIFLLVVLIGLFVVYWMQSGSRLRELEFRIKELSSLVQSRPVSPPQDKQEKEEAVTEEPQKIVNEEKPVLYPSEKVPPSMIDLGIRNEEEVARENEQKNIATFIPLQPPPPDKNKPRKPTFFERNPDLEKFIGENLINKIGIAVLVLGIGFFVKYAIDQNWINEIGRVAIGILCGGILLGIAHYLRKRFHAFSSVLVGGGISVLYFTIAIAFHQYQLFNQSAAFVIMVIITAFAVVLSLAYNRIELTVLSLLGGFATPFMVSTGEGNYIILFTYLMILNGGMLVIAYFRKWNLINLLSYICTVLIYGGWLVSKAGTSDMPYIGALVFATLFYFTFFIMHIINNIKEKRRFTWSEYILLLSNTCFYYSAGMYILHNVHQGEFEGMFTASLAIFNFIFAYVLYKRKDIDINLVYLLIGLVSFVSLTAPVQLHGYYITLFWSAEAVLLLWFSQKSGIKLMKLASIVVTALMLISLFMDWANVYAYVVQTGPLKSTMDIILNKGFITGLVSIMSLFASIYLLTRETENNPFVWLDIKTYQTVLAVINTGVIYLTIFFELNYQLTKHVSYEPANQVVIGFYNLLFLFGVNLYGIRKKKIVLSSIIIIVSTLILIVYMFYYNAEIVFTRNDLLLGSHATLGGYLFHYLTMSSALALLAATFIHIKQMFGLNSEMGLASLWFSAFTLVYIASAELSHACVMLGVTYGNSLDGAINQSVKVGYPILWGICSFILMITGMKLKIRHLRIVSLTLFFITLLKLFIYDIREVSEGGKIAAFISLGVILLIVSFMYQKLKVLILSDEGDKTKPSDNV